ncbi:hypothetical protein Adeg_1586 [Ammonifex degensii KC4]|uniref:Uncharacterized protein n=1 Tax=Ammonifex degensii (strain DSM 10501 / KC4) TaxID=429009 RepID=C9R8Q2_AMMDK|nr:hypothetical protein [Ammonifex degensii]ACX52681.1 hypothetical protein Adeg_1586 [Ammonifex degensii KC4]
MKERALELGVASKDKQTFWRRQADRMELSTTDLWVLALTAGSLGFLYLLSFLAARLS